MRRDATEEEMHPPLSTLVMYICLEETAAGLFCGFHAEDSLVTDHVWVRPLPAIQPSRHVSFSDCNFMLSLHGLLQGIWPRNCLEFPIFFFSEEYTSVSQPLCHALITLELQTSIRGFFLFVFCFVFLFFLFFFVCLFFWFFFFFWFFSFVDVVWRCFDCELG